MAKHERTHASTDGSGIALGVFFSLFLAVSLFAAGFAVCTLQPTTHVLSRLFSNFETSVYLPDDTVALAVATRDFTVDPYANGEGAAETTLAQAIVAAAQKSAAPGSVKANLWSGITIPSGQASPELMYSLSTFGSRYSFGQAEIEHLKDCNRLINTAVPILVVIFAAAVVLGAILLGTSRKRVFGYALVCAPAILLVAMLAIGVWAIIDFHGFFAAFHGLLFPQGNWTFPYDSLLICMLPTPFWIGMLVVWILITVGLSLVSVLLGRHLVRR